MPTTRARRAAARAAERRLLELPADVLSLVLYQLTLAHDIALTGLTCRQLCDAAKLALKLRPFSGEVVTLAGHDRGLKCVVATPDGREVTGSKGKTIKVWRDGACERTIQVHTSKVNAVAVLQGGARLFVSGSFDPTAKLWTLDGALERTFLVDSWITTVNCVAALPDGPHFVVGLTNGKVRLYSVGSEVRLYHVDCTLVHTFKGHTNWVIAVAVTPDGQHIISGSYDNLVKVWNVATKSLVSTCAGHTHFVTAVAAMPDGQRILSGSMDGTVRVHLLNGTLENTFELHYDDVQALVALPDNQHALLGSADSTVKLFNVNDGTVLRTFEHHTSRVFSLALLPDGLRFVSGSGDKTVRIAEIW